MTLRRKDRKA